MKLIKDNEIIDLSKFHNEIKKTECLAIGCKCKETRTFLRRGYNDTIALCEKHGKNMWNLKVGELSTNPIFPKVRAYKRLS